MALVECNNCRHMISSRARSCPRCASPAHAAPLKVSTYSSTPVAAKAAFAAAADFSIDSTVSFGPPDVTDSPDIEEEASQKAGFLAKLFARIKMRRKAKEETVTEELQELHDAPQEEEPQPEDLYYLTGEGRTGPVSVSTLYQMVSDGEIGIDTPVSQKGTSEWLTFAQYLKAQADRAMKTGAVGAGKGAGAFPWGIALSPFFGGMVPVLATQVWLSLGYKTLPYQAQLWWSVALLSSAACYFDLRTRRKSGDRVGTLDLWLCLLVPVYLYRRQKSALSLILTFLVWCASSLVALAGFVMVNGYNAPLLTVIERMIHVQRHLH